MTLTLPAILLRIEGAVLLASTALLYWEQGGAWLLFALGFFAPDLAMLGYAAGSRIGAMTYNALHTAAPALPLAAYGVIADQRLAVTAALIWLAHIGFDRFLGYGLKYPEGFKQTHLARV